MGGGAAVRADELPCLTGLRGLAAINVVIVHTQQNFFHTLFSEKSLPIQEFGVGIFFMLSGFLMGFLYGNTAFDARACTSFAAARIARIIPLYYVVVLLSVLMRAAGHDEWFYQRLGDTKEQTVSALLFMQAPFTLWTVPPECQYYLFFAILWALLHHYPTTTKRALWVFGPGYIIFAMYTFLASLSDGKLPVFNSILLGPIVGTQAWSMLYFGSGTMVGVHWKSHFATVCEQHPRVLNTVSLISLTVAIFSPLDCLGGQRFRCPGPLGGWHFPLPSGPLYTYQWPHGLVYVSRWRFDPQRVISYLSLLVCAAAGCNTLSWLRSAPMMFAGKISYCVYLIHNLVLVEVFYYFGDGVYQLLFSYILILILASASLYGLEQPLQRCIRSLAERLYDSPSVKPLL